MNGLIGALGGVAVAYGEGHPYRMRWRIVATVGCVFAVLGCISAVVGAVGAAHGGHVWGISVVLMMTFVVTGAAFIADALHVGPPGAFLFLLTAELAAVLAGVGGVSVYVIGTWTVIGALSGIAVSLSGWALSPHGPQRSALHAATAAVNKYVSDSTPRSLHHAVRALHDAWDCFDDAGISERDIPITLALRHVHRRLVRVAPAVHEREASEHDDVHVYRPLRRPGVLHRVRRAATPGSRTWTITIRVFVACTVAGLGSVALGLSRPDWAVISAAMILHQGPDRVLGSFRAVHRFAGTLLGLALLFGLQMGAPSAGAMVVIVALLFGATEALLVRNYGLAMAVITPMVMLLGDLGLPADIATATRDRLVETCVGVVVALAVLWGVRPRAYRHELLVADGMVVSAIGQVLAAISAGDRKRIVASCRQLEFDLRRSTTAAICAAHSNPRWTQGNWPAHERLHVDAYNVLSAAMWCQPPHPPRNPAGPE